MPVKTRLTATRDGHAVMFNFRVINDNAEPVEFTFNSSQVVDLTVTPRGTDEPVWRWGTEQAFGQAIRAEQLGPGETLEQSVVWDEPAPGDYEAVGRLAADDQVRAKTTIEL